MYRLKRNEALDNIFFEPRPVLNKDEIKTTLNLRCNSGSLPSLELTELSLQIMKRFEGSGSQPVGLEPFGGQMTFHRDHISNILHIRHLHLHYNS